MQSGRLKYLHLRYLDIFVDESKSIAMINFWFSGVQPERERWRSQTKVTTAPERFLQSAFYNSVSPFFTLPIQFCSSHFATLPIQIIPLSNC